MRVRSETELSDMLEEVRRICRELGSERVDAFGQRNSDGAQGGKTQSSAFAEF